MLYRFRGHKSPPNNMSKIAVGLILYKSLSGTLSYLMTHSFNWYLLSEHQVQSTMLDTGDRRVNRPYPLEIIF